MKRALDVTLAAVVLAVAAPVLGVLALLLLRRQGRPVLFTQERAGQDGSPFRLWKYRTMTDARGPDGALLGDDARLTAIGRWLRSISLDELPELWNVIRGDMSLVGPRPLPVRYLARYTAEESRRHAVRPGITGWAQVNGRNALSWDERLALDVWYVDHQSLRLDLRILTRTVVTVFRREGISGDGTETMRELRPHLTEGPSHR